MFNLDEIIIVRPEYVEALGKAKKLYKKEEWI